MQKGVFIKTNCSTKRTTRTYRPSRKLRRITNSTVENGWSQQITLVIYRFYLYPYCTPLEKEIRALSFFYFLQQPLIKILFISKLKETLAHFI